jgi:hypothetical protein
MSPMFSCSFLSSVRRAGILGMVGDKTKETVKALQVETDARPIRL